MPRPKNPTPSYLLHQKSGQARVRLKDGSRYRDVYLGEYGSPESLEKYHRVLAEYFETNGNGQIPTVPVTSKDDWTVATLAVKYDEFASTHYVKDGEPTNDRYRAVISPLVHLYGNTLACEFGPKKLKTLREHVIRRGNVRTAQFDDQGNLTKPGKPLGREYVNNLMKDVVRMFKWAVSEEQVPASVHTALTKVGGLRKGRDARVREPEPIRPVVDEHFWPVVEASSPQIATMLQVQRLAGMRPDEVTIIRPCDINQSGEVWVYQPDSHKLEWLDHEKEILLGPRAQELLLPWLVGRKPMDYLFSPREVAEANARQLEKRRKRPSNRKVKISKARPPRDHYDDRGYRQAVIRACRRASVPEWSPGQLRHTAGTEVRSRYGAEAAQLVLGHRNLSTTEIYAERNRARYEEVMKEIG